MKDIIPKEIQWRPYKTNLMDILKRNLFLFENNRIENIVYGKEEFINEYINLKDLQKIIKEYKKNNCHCLCPRSSSMANYFTYRMA